MVTDLFLSLTPERVFDAVEAGGLRSSPICQALNSFENRVYEIGLDDGSRVVGKFYRPGRWSSEQILDEHRFMTDLQQAEVSVCPVMKFPDGTTLKKVDHIYYCLFERKGGRAPDELTDALAQRLGMLVGRLHNVGAAGAAEHRIRLSADTYIRDNLAWMFASDVIPERLQGRYAEAANQIADIADKWMAGVAVHRVHGDFHLGNIVMRDELLHVLDFDDMLVGPAVQDLWMIVPGRDTTARRHREIFIEAYEQFRAFDRSTLRLIEPLRGMRMVHYSAWLARRWHDPIFPLTWPHFASEDYWDDETTALEELLTIIRSESDDPEVTVGALESESEPELTNKDLFWDWEE